MILLYVTLSAKTSLMLGVHKAGFRREAHIYVITFNVMIRNSKTCDEKNTYDLLI